MPFIIGVFTPSGFQCHPSQSRYTGCSETGCPKGAPQGPPRGVKFDPLRDPPPRAPRGPPQGGSPRPPPGAPRARKSVHFFWYLITLPVGTDVFFLTNGLSMGVPKIPEISPPRPRGGPPGGVPGGSPGGVPGGGLGGPLGGSNLTPFGTPFSGSISGGQMGGVFRSVFQPLYGTLVHGASHLQHLASSRFIIGVFIPSRVQRCNAMPSSVLNS